MWTSLTGPQQNEVLRELYEWGIVGQLHTVSEEGVQLALTAEFYVGITLSMTNCQASPWTVLRPAQMKALEEEETNEPTRRTTPEDLERHTAMQWDNVLHFMVGTVGHEEMTVADKRFLLQTGLMRPDPEYRGSVDQAPLVVTEEGFDFMFQDIHQQVWLFVLQYLKSLEIEETSDDLIREALIFIGRGGIPGEHHQ